MLSYGCVFFFKQKTAYEMRISDWSSDVCSSDLVSDGSLGGLLRDHSVDDVEGHPLGGRPDQTQQIATAFLNHLIGDMDMLRTRVDVTIDALHQPVMESRPARRSVGQCPDLLYPIVYMAHAHLVLSDFTTLGVRADR